MKTYQLLRNFWNDEDGGQVVEWPLIAALLAIAAIAGWSILDSSVTTGLTDIGNAITGRTGSIGT